MNIPLAGGSFREQVISPNPNPYPRAGWQTPTLHQGRELGAFLPSKSRSTMKHNHITGHDQIERRSPWPMVCQSVLLWSTLCTLLLLCLWGGLEQEGGHLIGVRDPESLRAAKWNCIFASSMYIIGGLVAAASLLWWHWWEPSKWESSQDLTHTASGYHHMESIQAHNNPFPSP